MFGKGAKRKLDDDEEGLEGKTLEAVAVAAGGGVVLGVSCPDGLSKVSYTLQRQTIFNISLMKLYSQRPLAEPRLERRVLINNMLRRIQEELQAEGSLRPLLLPPSPPPDDPMDEGFREAPPPFGTLATVQPSSLLAPPPPPSPHPLAPPSQRTEPGPAPPEAGLTPASLLEEDGGGGGGTQSPPTPPMSPPPATPARGSRLPAATPPPPRVLAPAASPPLSDMEVAASPPPPPAAARTATPNSSTAATSPSPPHSLAPPATPPAGHSRDCRPAGVQLELRPMDTLLPASGLVDASAAPSPTPAPPPSPSPSGFLSDLALDDVLFADIDTSMYDFDPCTTSGAVVGVASGSVGGGGGGGLAKLSPVVTADDLLKSLASPYSGPAPQVSTNQPFKIDLTELDHIMEVLVGS